MPSARYNELIELNKQEHFDPTAFTGQSLVNLICPIGNVLANMDCKTVLDYGCGKGMIQAYYHVDELWRVAYTGYDPCVPKFAKKPTGKFDAVICTDVLEHVPEPDLSEWVLDEVFGYANKIVFVKVPTYLADRSLPNGENCHCTIQPQEWWESTLKAKATQHGVNVAIWIKSKK